MPIPLDKKRGGNRSAFGDKASSKATFLILPLYNSSEDAFLLLLLYLLIVSSGIRFSVAKSSVGVFIRDNARKGKEDNPRNIGVVTDRRVGAVMILTFLMILITFLLI